MAKLQEIAPQIHWAYEKVKARYPQTNFKIRWCEAAEGFVIATDNLSLDNSREYLHFTSDLEDEIFHKCPFEIYFTYDSVLESEDYDIEDYDIDIEWYELEEESN